MMCCVAYDSCVVIFPMGFLAPVVARSDPPTSLIATPGKEKTLLYSARPLFTPDIGMGTPGLTCRQMQPSAKVLQSMSQTITIYARHNLHVSL